MSTLFSLGIPALHDHRNEGIDAASYRYVRYRREISMHKVIMNGLSGSVEMSSRKVETHYYISPQHPSAPLRCVADKPPALSNSLSPIVRRHFSPISKFPKFHIHHTINHHPTSNLTVISLTKTREAMSTQTLNVSPSSKDNLSFLFPIKAQGSFRAVGAAIRQPLGT